MQEEVRNYMLNDMQIFCDDLNACADYDFSRDLRQRMEDKRLECRAYTRAEGEDAPEIRDWAWQA